MAEGGNKNAIVAGISIVGIIFFLLWLNALGNVSKQRKVADSKAALIFELEEKNVKFEKERSRLSEELKSIQTQLKDEKAQHEETKKTLSQEQVAEQALKVELERVTRLKEALEKDFKTGVSTK